jgi:hypothetical protein
MILSCARLTGARQASEGALVCTLKDGVLRDSFLRTGSVVANHQFQFDGPPQAGAIYTGGFSVCTNGSVAIGSTTRWWQCSSGGFYNLYDEWIGAQCEEIRIQATFPQKPTPSSSSVASSSASSSSKSIVSIASSLITISGTVSTLPSSAVGPSASFSTGSVNATMTSGASSTTPTLTGTAVTATGSAGAGATGAAPAPPAGGAASLDMARGTMFGAVVAFAGAVFIL